jgi:hypothetical protein
LVTCKKCGREFKTEAALKDHLRDAQVHRDSLYEHKNQYGKWVLAVLAILVICGVAFFAVSQNPNGSSEVSPTASQVSSDIVFNNQTVKITSNATWISAMLHPVDKPHYKATGSMTLVDCPFLLGEASCPTIGLLVMNQTGFTDYQKGGSPVGPYGTVVVTPTLNEQTAFTLSNVDYDGTYYFVFIALNQGNPLSPGATVTILVYLTEVWS